MPIPLLAPDDVVTPFPELDTALDDPNGLLMAGSNLSPERLLSAYRAGIFPWYSEREPVLWWSPNPRCVLWPEAIRITRSLAKSLRNGDFEIRADTAFSEVVRSCSKPRPNSFGTWILPEMVHAYCRLFELGYAHSLECWAGERLVGGLYGVRMGSVFFGESMFSLVRDASKVALVQLCRQANITLIDCQISSPHLLRLGATTIPRTEFIRVLRERID